MIDFLGADGSGSGHSSSGDAVDRETVQYMIDTAINNLLVDTNVTLLSNGYARLDVDLNRVE